MGGTRGRSLACKQSCAAPPSGTRGRAPARHAGGMVLTRRDPGGPDRDEGRGRLKRPAVAVAGGRVHPRERYGKAPAVTGRLQRWPPFAKRSLSGSWTGFAALLACAGYYRALAGGATILGDRRVRPDFEKPSLPRCLFLIPGPLTETRQARTALYPHVHQREENNAHRSLRSHVKFSFDDDTNRLCSVHGWPANRSATASNVSAAGELWNDACRRSGVYAA